MGDLIVGLLTDKAISSHKKLPLLDYNQRKLILENIAGVTKVVPQNDWEYSKNILSISLTFLFMVMTGILIKKANY